MARRGLSLLAKLSRQAVHHIVGHLGSMNYLAIRAVIGRSTSENFVGQGSCCVGSADGSCFFLSGYFFGGGCPTGVTKFLLLLGTVYLGGASAIR